ncbi:unknown protein [Microcystis aeruginosa NIES-843]|uniref:Uncharacterized protein n=1 Tax=Microcystis aeruginosa (strain NIES-843 / IAM M-2473) TaxID=449447 RepID=B0JFU4_MICAN|nr:unknown protein [Microcystis aeruginosa NIES-843]
MSAPVSRLSLTYYRSDQSLCPLCLEWFLPLPVFTPILLRYIADTLNFSKQRS